MYYNNNKNIILLHSKCINGNIYEYFKINKYWPQILNGIVSHEYH